MDYYSVHSGGILEQGYIRAHWKPSRRSCSRLSKNSLEPGQKDLICRRYFLPEDGEEKIIARIQGWWGGVGHVNTEQPDGAKSIWNLQSVHKQMSPLHI